MNNLLKIRTELGFTQDQFSEKIGISRTALFNAEHGHCSVALAERVAKIFNINMFYVLGEDVFVTKPKTMEDVKYLKETMEYIEIIYKGDH